MDPFYLNVSKCATCPLMKFGERGAALCTVNGLDIIDIAKAGTCPHPAGPRFTLPASTPIPNTLAPRPAASTPSTSTPPAQRGGGCGCSRAKRSDARK